MCYKIFELNGDGKMEINLSEEMIEKITLVSAGRLSDLKEREEPLKIAWRSGKRKSEENICG